MPGMEIHAPQLINPYHADYADEAGLPAAPFAGRTALFSRLYQALTASGSAPLMAISGRRHLGKSAFLHACPTALNGRDAAGMLITAYVPLASPPLTEIDLVLVMAQSLTAALIERGLSVQRLAAVQPPTDDARAWLVDEFLPAALHPARHLTRVVLLLDDADRLIGVCEAGRLPADLPAWLAGLPAHFPALACVITLSGETDASASPLIDPLHLYRLDALTADETRHILATPARGCYAMPDECAAAVHRATGGHPALVQQFGYQLFRRWEAVPELNVITLDDVRTLTPVLLNYAEDEYRGVWSRLTANERLTLTALNGLLMDDPLRTVDAAAASAWLLESDHPLDAVAVGAALRSLDFRGITHAAGVGKGGAGGVVVTAGLFQLWLRQHAGRGSLRGGGRVTDAPVNENGSPAEERRPVPVAWIIGAGVALGVIVALIVLATLAGQGTIALPGGLPAPTITLVP